MVIIAGMALDVFENDLRCPLKKGFFGEGGGDGGGGGGVGSVTIAAEMG